MEVIGVGVRRCVALVTGGSAGHRTLDPTPTRADSAVVVDVGRARRLRESRE
jgi:hypothetical protein